MKIEIPKFEDFEEINKLARQVHEIHVNWRPDIFVSVEYPIQQDRLKELIENKQIYVIKEKEKILGYATIDIKEKTSYGTHYRKYLSIEAIAVDENCRGKGYGTKLIEFLKELGRKEKCTDLYLTVNEENKDAIKLYEKLGMRVKSISYSGKL